MKKMVPVTSKSSDTEIKSFITALNRKIKGYRNTKTMPVSEEVYENFADKVQNSLTFNRWTKGHAGYESEGIELKEGKNGIYVPTTKDAVDYIRKTLETQEAAFEKQEKLNPDYKRGKTIAESLADLPTLKEKIVNVTEQLKDPERYESVSGEKAIDTSGLKGKAKKEAEKQNKFRAITEINARASEVYSTTFSEDIDKIYEDSTGNADLIARLNSERWDASDLMEEVHIRALGIDMDIY